MATNNFLSFLKHIFKKQKTTYVKNNTCPLFTLSEESVLFIKKYAVPALKIQGPINEDILYEISNFADECEQNMIDPSSKYWSDKTYDYPEKERDILGDKYVSEVSGRWSKDYLVDLEDLNKRLGFIK